MYTLGAGRILIKSIIIVCLLNLMAWKVSRAHRIGENEKKDNDKIKKSVQTSSACGHAGFGSNDQIAAFPQFISTIILSSCIIRRLLSSCLNIVQLLIYRHNLFHEFFSCISSCDTVFKLNNISYILITVNDGK